MGYGSPLARLIKMIQEFMKSYEWQEKKIFQSSDRAAGFNI